MDVRVENLQKKFTLNHGVEVKVLRGLTLDIHSGETVSIVGPSGAGKSTLLHVLGLMDRPTSGRIILDGRDVSKADDRERAQLRRKEIGFLFQLHYLLPEFTVWENVLIPVWNDRLTRRQPARDMLVHLGLEERLDHLPSELSGGEQQRVALARALINEPRLLLADEPTGNLDRETGDRVEDLIFSECRRRSITLVLVTHNPALARKSGRIINLIDGALADTTVKESCA